MADDQRSTDPARSDADAAAGSSSSAHDGGGEHEGGMGMSYWRFAAMIATSVVVMFLIKYLSTYTWTHVWYSEMRTYMALMMGGAMAIIMLGFMLSMYRNRAVNIAIFAGSAVFFLAMLFLVRSQVTVQQESYMRSMIPHHSIAILTSERSDIDDQRVCRLAQEIILAQRREIQEMEWLLEDIDENGAATTAEEAEQRPVPEFEAEASPECTPAPE